MMQGVPLSANALLTHGDALEAVVVEDLLVDVSTREATHYKNPSFELSTNLRGQDGFKSIGLTE